MSALSTTKYAARLPDALIPPILDDVSGLDRRSFKTPCSRFSVNGSEKGIYKIPLSLLRQMLEYLDQPREDTYFRITCVRFRNYYPQNSYLNFDSALSHCKTRHCDVLKHISRHCLGMDRIIPKYQRHGCRIRGFEAIHHGVGDSDVAHLRGHPLKVLKITGDRVTKTGMKIIADLPLTVLHFYGLQRPDIHLEYFKNMSLRVFCISSPVITDQGLKYLEKMPLLQLKISCYYWGAFITGYGLKYLWKMPLADLEINDSWLSYSSLSLLKCLPLERLSLRTSLPILSFENLSAFKQEMPKLKKIELNGFEV